ncbi:hypothetical protein B0H19DRAFT_1086296 [Mycena capillaripes]|nr:hypothetical protein B0H19DRAFT_1086296 [Mycena capillaripes]
MCRHSRASYDDCTVQLDLLTGLSYWIILELAAYFTICGHVWRYSSLGKFPEPGLKNECKKRIGCGGLGSDTGVRQILVPSICGAQTAIPSRADAGRIEARERDKQAEMKNQSVATWGNECLLEMSLKMRNLKPSDAPVRDADSWREAGHTETLSKRTIQYWGATLQTSRSQIKKYAAVLLDPARIKIHSESSPCQGTSSVNEATYEIQSRSDANRRERKFETGNGDEIN